MRNKIKIGDKFSLLTVIEVNTPELKEYAKSIKVQRTFCKCICVCGKIKIINSHYLTQKKVQSCGCLRLESSKKTGKYLIAYKEINRIKKRKPDKEAQYNRVERSYKQSAKKRNLEYSLTKEQFREIVTQVCHYCGSSGSLINRFKNKNGEITLKNYLDVEWIERQNLIINGIDRKDNNLGYTYENSLPCCKICNRGKNDMSYTDFIEYINKLFKFRGLDV